MTLTGYRTTETKERPRLVLSHGSGTRCLSRCSGSTLAHACGAPCGTGSQEVKGLFIACTVLQAHGSHPVAERGLEPDPEGSYPSSPHHWLSGHRPRV